MRCTTVLEGGCLGRGYLFSTLDANHENRGNHEANDWKQLSFKYYKFQYFEEPWKPRDEIFERDPLNETTPFLWSEYR